MIFYNFLTPGIFLMLAGVLLGLVPKKIYKPAVILFIAISYSVLCIGINKWNFYWYEQFLFTDERIIFILTSIFFLVLFISIPIAFCEKGRSTSGAPLLFIYVGATVSILFTKSLLCILLFLEIMMLSATFIIFASKDALARAEGLNYFRFHMLGGTLLLAGIVSYYLKHNTFEISLFNRDNFRDFSAVLILLGLLVNLAVPPFSSWLLGGYSVTSSYASLVLAICTTKIAALLTMQLFAGWHSLIFIGILTSIYGVIYSIFENNIRRIILYIIIAELGLILIFIGVGESIMNTALASIINDLLCIPTILCSANFVIHFFKKRKITEIKNIFGSAKLIVFLNSIALFSIAALPFTLGYISKKYLYASEYFAGSHWLPYIVDLISGGIAFSICFKFVIFVLLKDFSFASSVKAANNRSNSETYFAYIFALAALYMGILGLTIYFALILGMNFVEFDSFMLGQVRHILIVGVIFFLSKKYLIYDRDMRAFDPNILYLSASKGMYEQLVSKIRYFRIVVASKLNSWFWRAQSYVSQWFANQIILTKSIGWAIAFAVALVIVALS